MPLNNLNMLKAKEAIQGWVPVTFSSRIDAFNVDRFKESLSDFCDPQKRLALDMRDVQFINYEAIRHIHQLAIELESSGGELALVGPTEKLKRQVSLFASLDPIRVFSRREWESLATESADARA